MKRFFSIKKKNIFLKVIKIGRRICSKSMNLYSTKHVYCIKPDYNNNSCKNNYNNNSLFGISVPKKIVKKSFKRNLYKRWIKEIFTCFIKDKKEVLNKLNSLNDNRIFFVVIKPAFLQMTFLEIKKELITKLNFLL